MLQSVGPLFLQSAGRDGRVVGDPFGTDNWVLNSDLFWIYFVISHDLIGT